MKRIYIICLGILAGLVSLTGCGTKNPADKKPPETKPETDVVRTMELPEYIKAADEKQTGKFALTGKSNGNCMTGIMISSFYTAKINGKKAPVYMVAAAETGPHSVVYAEVSEDVFERGGELKVELNGKFSIEKAVVIPLKRNVTAGITNNVVMFSIKAYGDYTVVPNDPLNPENMITIFVRKPERVEVGEGQTLIEYKKGLHFVDTIELKSNTVLYLHSGALLVAKPPENEMGSLDWQGARTYKPFIGAVDQENIKIAGHGVMDFSLLTWHARKPVSVRDCKNIDVSGITIINSPDWSMTYTNCENLSIRDCVIFGYRTNSDGYAICSSKNVVVKDSFARSGDDLFEVKTYGTVTSENILFENCTALPDSCRGFGIVQETLADIRNVTYRNCSLLYQLKNWSEKMGSFVVTAGEPGNVSGILFENCDLFHTRVWAVRLSTGKNDESAHSDFNNRIGNVVFKNCSFKTGNIKIRNATGDPDSITGLVFENTSFSDRKWVNKTDVYVEYEGHKTEFELR